MLQKFMRPAAAPVLLLGVTASTIVGAIVMPQQSFAATLARANADVKVFGFSHQVESVLVDGSTDVQIENTLENQVSADADIQLEFDDVTQVATNSTKTIAQGTIPAYKGLAQAKSIFQELNFSVGAGDLFQFNFDTIMDVFATTTNPAQEDAIATGNVAFQVFHVGANNRLKLLDYFDIFGLDTGNHGSLFGLDAGRHFQVKQSQQQGSQLFLSGLFSRKFKDATNLRIVQLNHNESAVYANVPEPATMLGLVGLGGLLVGTRRRSR
jgi:hypothetical protein